MNPTQGGSSADVPLWRQMVRSWRFKFVVAVTLGVCVFIVTLALGHPETTRWPFLTVGSLFLSFGVLVVSPIYPPFRRLSAQSQTVARIFVGTWMLPSVTLVVAGVIAAIRAQ